jgi:RNA polymerase sigma-70 factor (ECF subfamily)
VLESFERAVETGELQDFLDVLAPDVVLLTDGGGLKQSALRPIVGAEKIVRFFLGATSKAGAPLTTEQSVVNGSPAIVVRLGAEIDGVLAVRVEAGRITRLYYVRNPQKLTRVEAETALTLE